MFKLEVKCSTDATFVLNLARPYVISPQFTRPSVFARSRSELNWDAMGALHPIWRFIIRRYVDSVSSMKLLNLFWLRHRG